MKLYIRSAETIITINLPYIRHNFMRINLWRQCLDMHLILTTKLYSRLPSLSKLSLTFFISIFRILYYQRPPGVRIHIIYYFIVGNKLMYHYFYKKLPAHVQPVCLNNMHFLYQHSKINPIMRFAYGGINIDVYVVI